MKKILTLIVVAVIGATSAFAQVKGDKAVGLNFLYGTGIESVGLGAKFQYNVLDPLRLEGSFNYFFKRKGQRGWEVNATAHYLFPISSRFTLYPLAGIKVANVRQGDFGDNSITKFGANLGGGCDFNVTENWLLNAEIRYSIVSDIDQAVFSIGAGYRF